MKAILSVLAFSVVYVVWFFLQSCLFKIVGNNLNFGVEIQVKIFRKAILMYFFSSLRTLLCRGPDVLSSHTLGVVCSFGATALPADRKCSPCLFKFGKVRDLYWRLLASAVCLTQLQHRGPVRVMCACDMCVPDLGKKGALTAVM